MRIALIALLLVLLGVGLLYAYRAQNPLGTSVPYSQVVSEIQGGQVNVVAEHNSTVPPNQRTTVAASGPCC